LIDWDALTRAALDARALAYAPYSGYRVGAALLADDGVVFTGANLENASYGLCLCAERVAMARALMEGAKGFRAIVVATGGPAPAAPCGMCRQVLVEHAPGMPVRCVTADADAIIDTDASSLQPHAFDASFLDDD